MVLVGVWRQGRSLSYISAAPTGSGVPKIFTGRFCPDLRILSGFEAPGRRAPDAGTSADSRRRLRKYSFSLFFRFFSVSESFFVFYIVVFRFFSEMDLEMEAEIHQKS